MGRQGMAAIVAVVSAAAIVLLAGGDRADGCADPCEQAG